MAKKYFFSTILAFSALLIALIAPASLSAQRTCSATDHHQHLLETDTAYTSRFRAAKAKTDALQEIGFRQPPGNIVTIPVAVHYEGLGIGMQCGIDKALSQVQILNEDFGGTNADLADYPAIRDNFFPGIESGSTCFRFCLASINHPAGSGIAEGDYAITLDAGLGDNAPDWAGYLNFFVRDLGGGLLGFSPLGASLTGDGVTCTADAFGTVDCDGSNVNGPYDLGRTISHEAGHYFGLPHPFESPDCVADSDGVADTPVSNAEYTGCPNAPITTCTDPALWTTYMEYCDDACLIMFSEGQTDLMNNHFTANVEANVADATTRCSDLACSGFSGARTVTNETCDGNDGSITMTPFNGDAPFEYSINGGVSFFPTPVFNNVTQGTYDLVIRDGNSCEWASQATVNRDPAQVNIVSLQPSFCGNADGEIVVNVGSSGSYNYFLNGEPSTTGGTFSNIPGGVYDITVAGNNGCLGGVEINLPNEDDLDINVGQIRPVTCFLFDNGSIEFSLGGGEAPFSYLLSDGSDTSSVPFFDGLAVGEYNIVVLDGRNCRSDIPFQIFEGTGISDDCPCEIFAPTAFTVDQDDLNEYWQMYSSCPLNKFELLVFGRNGEIVFQTDDINQKWNGGASADYYVSPEIFYYRLRFSWGGQGDIESIKEKTGFISVLR